MKSKFRLFLTITVLMVLMLAACDGGGGSNDPTATAVEESTMSTPVSEATESIDALPEEDDTAKEEVPTEEEIEY